MLHLKTFGGLSVDIDGIPGTGAAQQRKTLALLALLAAAGQRGLSRDKLIATLWPETDAEHGRGLLRQACYALRRDLHAPDLFLGSIQLRLNPAVISSDVESFASALEENDPGSAVSFHTAPFLDGFYLNGGGEFETWAETERARLASQCRGALEALSTEASRRGEHLVAADWWRRLLELDPLSSHAVLGLMTALDNAGEHAEALRRGQAYGELVHSELGADPPAEVSEWIEQHRHVAGNGVAANAVAGNGVGLSNQPPAGRPAPGPAEARGVAEPHLKRWRAGVLLVFAFFLLGVGWLLWRGRHLPADGLSATHVAVFPFSVRGSPESAYLGEGIVDLLSADLDGLGELRTVDSRAVLSRRAQLEGASPLPRDFRAAAAELGAGSYVVGDIVEAGGRLRISARFHTVGRPEETPVLARVEGYPGRLFELVDSLAGQLIAGRIDVSGRGFAGLAAITTSSLRALKAYLTGEAALRAGRHPAALEAFQEATRLDTTFALAHYGVARAAAWWRGNPSVAYAASRQAYRHRDRVGWRVRRLIEVFDARMHHRHAEVEHLYREILARYPNQFEAWLGLGGTLFHYGMFLGRSWDEARVAYQHATALDPWDAHPLWYLTYIAAREGRLAELDSITNRLLQLEPGAFAPAELVVRGQRAVLKRDTAEVDRFVATVEGLSAEQVQLTGGMVTWTTGDIAVGRRLWRLVAEPSRPPGMRALARMTLAKLEVTAGRWRAAKAQLDSLQAIDYSTGIEHRAYFALARFLAVPHSELEALRDTVMHWDATVTGSPDTTGLLGLHAKLHPYLRLYLLGLLNARLGDTAAARSYASKLQRLSRRSHAPIFVADLGRVVQMEVAWVAGRLEEALSTLEGAVFWSKLDLPADNSPFLERSYERFARAELLHGLGRWKEAARWYEPMVDAFVYAGGPSAMRLAQLHDRWGTPERAKAYHAHFLRWWQDCDPELRALVAEASQRF